MRRYRGSWHSFIVVTLAKSCPTCSLVVDAIGIRSSIVENRPKRVSRIVRGRTCLGDFAPIEMAGYCFG
jgi:hypothetical protein